MGPLNEVLVPLVVGLGVLCAAGSAQGEVVATAAGIEIHHDELELRGAVAGDRERVVRAIASIWDELLLVSEAPGLLGPDAEGKTRSDVVRAVRRKLFDPHVVCVQMAEPLRRTLYEEQRWRFVAPPAWRVDDVQLLCCDHPRNCGKPEVRTCLREEASGAQSLARELHQATSRERFLEVFRRARPERPRLAQKTYTFYFDPGQPDGEVDWRLQTVDKPVAEEVAKLQVGQISQVIETRFGHHVIRLAETRPSVNLTWEDPRTQSLLRAELCPSQLIRLEQQYLLDLRRQLPLALKPEVLQRRFGVELGSFSGP